MPTRIRPTTKALVHSMLLPGRATRGGGQYLVEDAGVDVNKATTAGTGFTTPLHTAVGNNHIDVAVCLMERGMADLNARTTDGRRPMDHATNEAMRQAIVNEEKRRRDHGFKRSVIPPNPTTAAGQESNEKNEEEGEAPADAEEEKEDDDDDDSSSSDDEDDN